MAKAILKFDGVVMPTPKFNGFKVSHNKIWSKNSGRNGEGSWVGSIIAVKTKVEITWPVLDSSQISTISNIVDSTTAFHSIDYTNEKGVTQHIDNVYFGDGIYPILGMNINGKQLLEGVGIDAIEK